ncbi:MAG: isoprenylcysteine carboxylmethyltransferase family protein [Balneolaceae bacterium]
MFKLKIPPVAVSLVFLGLIWLTDHLFSNEVLAFPYKNWLVGVLLLLGAIVALLGVWEFRKKSTTVNPHKPQNTSDLVDSGIYRLSRNPMYLGLFLMLCAGILYLGNVYNLLVLPLFVCYMNCFQIIPEEEVMLQKFAGDFKAYKNEVRRWI